MSDKRDRSRRSRSNTAFDQPDYSFDRYVPRPAVVAPPPPVALDAVVKRYDGERGFGFVAIADGSPDAFIHASVIAAAGHKSVAPGMRLRVRVADGERGRQVTEVLSVEAGATITEITEAAETAATPGTVKWFRADKGFGFIKLADDQEVYVHVTALRRSNLAELQEGQKVNVDIVAGKKGPEARYIKIVEA